MSKEESYWHSKHHQTAQMYNGRPLPNGKTYELDVRRFIYANDLSMLFECSDFSLKKETIEETVQAVQTHVVHILKYTPDETLGRSEYWLFPSETLAMRKGDCEDGALLIHSLLLNLLPKSEHWRVRSTAGIVQESPTAPQVGHMYVTFCRPEDNEWVAIDWCYYEDSHVAVNDKPVLRDVAFYKKVWFSFTNKYAYSHLDFKMNGRVK